MRDYKIPILMYHSIESMPQSTVMRSLHVSPRRFKFQMWLLNFLGYKGLSMRELYPYINGTRVGKVIGITFDDGYQNNLCNAAPILKKYNFTATCYIVKKEIGTSNVWDSRHGITQRPLMSVNEIKEWIAMGMDIGAHSQTHADLTKINKKQAFTEIFDCKAELEKEFDMKIVDFCYPYGRFDSDIMEIVERAGYFSATTMIRGRSKIESNKYMLPRIPINYHTLPHLFLIKILTRYEEKRQ